MGIDKDPNARGDKPDGSDKECVVSQCDQAAPKAGSWQVLVYPFLIHDGLLWRLLRARS